MAVLIAVGLISTFIVTLGKSLSVQEEREKADERFQSLLSISDPLTSGVFSGGTRGAEPGLLSYKALKEKLPRTLEKMSQEGVQIQVKISSFGNEPLFEGGRERENLASSLSLPIVYEHENTKIPARISIWIWK